MKTFLVLYIIAAGQMSTVRIPQDTPERCEANRAPMAQQLGAVHAECKLRTVKAPKAAE